MHFDARAAKLLNPGEHLLVSGCPGLRLEVSVSRKTWTYRYKSVNGGWLKQVAIGHWPATSVQTAAAKWQELRDQRDAGTDPGQQRRIARKASLQGQGSAYTVNELVQDFIKGHLLIYRRVAGALAAQRALDDALARSIGYQRYTRHPALRPVAASTNDDSRSVSQSLSNYATCVTNFACSDPTRIAHQKKTMLVRCAEFARDYQLQFTPT